MGCSSSKNSSGVPGLRVNRDFVGGGGASPVINFKICMIGDKGVGKSSVVLRYTKDLFEEGMEAPTIGAAFSAQTVPVVGGECKLHVWDTAGEELYRSMTRSFFRNSYAAVLVFDMTRRPTFDALEAWVKDFRDFCPTAFMVLVANKVDQEGARTVTTEEGKLFATSHRMTYFESSARTNVNITELFTHVAQRLHDSK